MNSLCLVGMRPPSSKTLSILLCVYKMENMRMTKLRALAKERELRGYSKLRKTELIAFLKNNEKVPTQPARIPCPNIEQTPSSGAHLTKWQHKCR